MQLNIDLPDDLARFAQDMTELLEYPSVDAFLAALLERQRDTLAKGLEALPAGVEWTPQLHDELRRRIMETADKR